MVKNKFIVVLIVAIVLWWVLWVYLAKTNNPEPLPKAPVITNTWEIKDAWDVLKKLNDLAE